MYYSDECKEVQSCRFHRSGNNIGFLFLPLRYGIYPLQLVREMEKQHRVRCLTSFGIEDQMNMNIIAHHLQTHKTL